MKPSDIVVLAYEQAKRVRQQAYAPYSHFLVGAALVDAQGVVYTGCNVENASYGATICAERGAVLKAVSEGSRKITHVVVVAESVEVTPPCGMCLQVLGEFCDAETEVWLGNEKGLRQNHKMRELLPYSFNKSQLQNMGKK